MMYHAVRRGVRGLGDCAPDDSSCVDTSGAGVSNTLLGGDITAGLPGGTGPSATPLPAPTGNPSTGFNWGAFFTGIFPTVAADATKIGQQAIATPGTVITPQGTIAVGTAQGQPSIGAAATASSISGLMPLILLGLGGVVLVMAMKR